MKYVTENEVASLCSCTNGSYPVPPYRSLYPVDVQYFKYNDGNGELYYQMISTNTVSVKYVFEPITPEDV